MSLSSSATFPRNGLITQFAILIVSSSSDKWLVRSINLLLSIWSGLIQNCGLHSANVIISIRSFGLGARNRRSVRSLFFFLISLLSFRDSLFGSELVFYLDLDLVNLDGSGDLSGLNAETGRDGHMRFL